MAFFTSRYNVKPVVRGIAFVVMVILCLCGAVMALQGIGLGEYTKLNSMGYSRFSFNFFGMSNMVSLCVPNMSCSAFFALVISFLSSLAILLLTVSFPAITSGYSTLFALTILLLCKFATFALSITPQGSLAFICLSILLLESIFANFAIIAVSIGSVNAFVKLAKRFCLFANVAGFCFNWFSHLILSPIKNYLVRAGCWHVPAVGSLNSINYRNNVKSFFSNLGEFCYD